MTWAALAVGAFMLLFVMEHLWPLRRRLESTLPHLARNLVMATPSALVIAFADRPLMLPLAAHVEAEGWGLLQQMGPGPLRIGLSLLLLDYVLYVWHRMLHRVPFLWRSHVVHHMDLDLDVSTGIRFHLNEALFSIPWRLAQILLLGIGPAEFTLYQSILFLSVLFHHSNVRLPSSLERVAVHLFVTPRMHGIHHSAVRAETDSNWSSLLNIWDRLHGSLRLDVPQAAIVIGVPAYRHPENVGLATLLRVPYRSQIRDWQPPETDTHLRSERS